MAIYVITDKEMRQRLTWENVVQALGQGIDDRKVFVCTCGHQADAHAVNHALSVHDGVCGVRDCICIGWEDVAVLLDEKRYQLKSSLRDVCAHVWEVDVDSGYNECLQCGATSTVPETKWA